MPVAKAGHTTLSAMRAGCSRDRMRVSGADGETACRIRAPDFATRTHQARLDRVERPGHALGSSRLVEPGVDFRISSRVGLRAWAWPSGRIEVTGALIDLLDDHELSAALAHEIAHLRNGSGAADGGAALASADNDSVERDADRAGCAMLADAGLPPQAMVSMLSKVATGLRDPHALSGRIEAASTACIGTPGPLAATR